MKIISKKPFPNAVLSFLQRGYAAMRKNNITEAVQWFEKAVKQNPKDPENVACLGQSLYWQGECLDGIVLLRKAAKLIAKKAGKSRNISDLLAITEQLQSCNDFQGSLEFVRQSVKINQADARGFQLLALTYSRLNQRKMALQASRQALKLAPENPVLNILLAGLEADNGQYDAGRQRLERVLQSTSIAVADQFRAHKELARILDKQGAFDKVFAHLHVAADLSGQLPEVKQLDASIVAEMLAINKAGFDRELLHRWSDARFANEQPAPVFLVGFLRSGTTLVQQVLDAHPDVFVADETELIVAVRNELDLMSGSDGSTPEQLKNIDLPGINHLRQFYWEQVEKRYGKHFKQQLFIDKTSLNTIDLGLINCVFPDAKVVFVLRDPRDVCISCFMQLLALTTATVPFLSWEKTVALYCQTMDWWLYLKQQMSLQYLECRYEDTVINFESVFSEIFSFLGLSWHPAAADFHQQAAKKFIASPSFKQVTQPLYASSLARWKNYLSEFATVSGQLQPFIHAFGYNQ